MGGRERGIEEKTDTGYEKEIRTIIRRLEDISCTIQPVIGIAWDGVIILRLIEKLEEKIINEDYSDLLLIIKKIKEQLKK